MCSFVVSTETADALAPSGTRTPASMAVSKFCSRMYWRPAIHYALKLNSNVAKFLWYHDDVINMDICQLRVRYH